MATATATELEVNDLFFTSELPWRAVSTPRVLIVEDDADVQQGWSVFLRHQGYDVEVKCDGASGLAALESQEHDVVLLDLGLPGMHGLKVLHEIRMRGVATHIVVVTASSSPDTDRRATRAGAELVLAKPVSPHRLVAVIEGLLAG
ncbi:MAG: response regulator [Planctomycetes bacterium]|nr:response regulator [Planctomycetota bacterium]